MPTEEYTDLRKEIRRLADEQQKLRAEQQHVKEAWEHMGRRSDSDNNGSGAEDQTSDGGRTQPHAAEHEDRQNDEGNAGTPGPRLPRSARARQFASAHPLGTLLGALGLVALLTAGILLWRYLGSYETTDDAQVDGHLISVTSRIAGTVKRVDFEDNQPVTAGQEVVKLDPSDYQVALEQSRGGYAQATAALEATNPNVPILVTSNQSEISTGQAGVATAQAALAAATQTHEAKLADLRRAVANNDKAQSDLRRFRPLVEKDEISHEQFDTLVEVAKSSTEEVRAAQAGVEAANHSIDEAKAQLAEAASHLDQITKNAPRSVYAMRAGVAQREAGVAAAQLDQSRLNLSYTRILSQADGIVGERAVEVGQSIAPGQQLMVISLVNDLWITANFKETQLRFMRPGQAVIIHVDTFGKDFRGYVESMPGATGARTSLLPPENATGNYVKVVQRLPVRIRLKSGEDTQHTLRPGMSVEPKVWIR